MVIIEFCEMGELHSQIRKCHFWMILWLSLYIELVFVGDTAFLIPFHGSTVSVGGAFPSEEHLSTERMPNFSEGWQQAPLERFRYLVSIRNRARDHLCMGILIESQYILTSAFCIQIVGPNSLVMIGPYGKHNDQWTPNVHEARVENTIIHPNWTGNVVDGYDAAILRLPQPLSIKAPSLCSKHCNVYPNHKAHILNLDRVVETAELCVVQNKLCPHLSNLTSDMFCIYSQTTAPCQSCSGGPVIFADFPSAKYDQNGVKTEKTTDLVVGLLSFANFTSFNESGIGCVPISKLEGWIKQIINGPPRLMLPTYFIWGTVFVPMTLMLGVFFLVQGRPTWIRSLKFLLPCIFAAILMFCRFLVYWLQAKEAMSFSFNQ